MQCFAETIVFTHERLFLPMGPPLVPPVQSACLIETRQLIAQGLFSWIFQL